MRACYSFNGLSVVYLMKMYWNNGEQLSRTKL